MRADALQRSSWQFVVYFAMDLTPTEWAVAIAAAALVIAATTFLRWRQERFNFFKKRGIPGPKPSFISGNFHQLWNEDTNKVMNEWSKTYGDIYGIFIGDAPFLMVKDLELLRRVFVTDFALFTDKGDVLATTSASPEVQNSISVVKADRWKYTRRAISMAFTASKMRRMMSEINESVDQFLDLLESKANEAEDGEANVYPLLGKLAFDIVAETACGLYLDVQHKPGDEYFKSAHSLALFFVKGAFQRAGQFLTGMKVMPKLASLLELQFDQGPFVTLKRQAEVIAQHRAQAYSPCRPDLLQCLLETEIPKELLSDHKHRVRTGEKGEFLMPFEDIGANIASVLSAGFETVSTSSAYLVFCLAKYTDAQEKVREEVNAAYEKHGGFSYEAIKGLTYTTQVLFEALRLYSPVIVFASRKASRDYQYMDMTIPKGLNILSCTQQIHRDSRFWDRPDEFDPDRFSPEQKAARHDLAFQAFGVGPRNCAGMRLAQLELIFIIAKLVHRFRLRLGSRQPGGEMEQKTQSIIASPKNGVWVQLEKLR